MNTEPINGIRGKGKDLGAFSDKDIIMVQDAIHDGVKHKTKDMNMHVATYIKNKTENNKHKQNYNRNEQYTNNTQYNMQDKVNFNDYTTNSTDDSVKLTLGQKIKLLIAILQDYGIWLVIAVLAHIIFKHLYSTYGSGIYKCNINNRFNSISYYIYCNNRILDLCN
ncbi:MAG: hypothetical protein IJ593_10675 [Lachnospiraceae bacterium]|nr:hypothetical protein [Lachnospiraceae bacterium]